MKKNDAGVWHYYDSDDDMDDPDEDVESWYYFGSDGKMYKEYKQKKINGKYYFFNEHGQMQTGLQPIGDAATNKLNFYYFDENGYMKTGKVSNVEEENDSFTYYFETKNGGNGKGVTGEKSGYLYWNGKRLEADDDYRVYKVEGNYYLVNSRNPQARITRLRTKMVKNIRSKFPIY